MAKVPKGSSSLLAPVSLFNIILMWLTVRVRNGVEEWGQVAQV